MMKEKEKTSFGGGFGVRRTALGIFQRVGDSLLLAFGRVLEAHLFENPFQACDMAWWGWNTAFQSSPFSLRLFAPLRSSDDYFCL
jgi:hypothetical protein